MRAELTLLCLGISIPFYKPTLVSRVTLPLVKCVCIYSVVTASHLSPDADPSPLPRFLGRWFIKF
ncbi:protein of unknown function [Pseudomonas mediterranea]